MADLLPLNVDDFYFSAFLDEDDDIFPISDEKYALHLQLQEALFSSSTASTQNSSKKPLTDSTQASSSSSHQSLTFCDICMDTKPSSQMFQNPNACTHLFCTDCIGSHIAVKIQQNIAMVPCPDPKCQGAIGPELCGSIVPEQVLERWENALCESVILGSQKFYCPFKDCSAMLVDDGGETVTESECPNCNRLFCAQCKVAWHAGMGCREFQSSRDPQDRMLMELAKTKEWRRCPNCRFYFEKTDGCHHISCRCGYHFCYGCGKEHTGNHVCHQLI